MTNKRKYLTLIFLTKGLLLSSRLFGQATVMPDSANNNVLGIWEATAFYSSLLQTKNATGLYDLRAGNTGHSQITGSALWGNFRRPQQASSSASFSLQTERYQQTKHLIWYGKFSFRQQQDKDLQWTSVLDPYRGTPYILADSIGGTWNKQFIDLQTKVSTLPILNDKLLLGMDLKFRVATGAKQIDPRPLSNQNNLQISPSALWQISANQKIGAQVGYGFDKEDIAIEIRQASTSHNIYRLKGLSIHDGIIPVSSTASRAYNGQSWNAGLQYQKKFNTYYELTAAADYRRYNESTRDGSTYPMPAGDYDSRQTSASITLLKKNAIWQQLKLAIGQQQDEGTEYHTTFDNSSSQYITTFSGILYQRSKKDIDLQYQWAVPLPTGDIGIRWGAGARYETLQEDYLYTQISAQKIDKLILTGHIAYNRLHNWRFNMRLSYDQTLQKSLNYTPKSGLNTTAEQILYPDFDYLVAPKIQGSWDVKRMVRFQQMPKVQWYIQGSYAHLYRLENANYSNYGQNRGQVNLSIGLYH
ncbi:DUF6850 family outer membrane beta-barrel protein [Sphingobacterium sp. LRF_L2]|uniref:DUF6850 family outer membrane beta-barrel protein n=1 Tax=Sphingobacterium sp. LRF_L2 TaxID=3369421 RepID=UPI003F5F078C